MEHLDVAFWLQGEVQRCSLRLPLSARKQTSVPQCPVFGRLLPLNPRERTWRGGTIDTEVRKGQVASMPTFDLRDQSGGLHPLAPFKVLAVMCHPTDRKMRERMLAPVQRETAARRARGKGLSHDQILREVQLRGNRAVLAGGLLLTLLQLRENGFHHSLNRAIPLITPLLDRWEQPAAGAWSPDCHVAHRPHSRRKVLDAFNEFLCVAHCWAALIHGGQHQRPDIWPGSNETLPRFLAYTEAFALRGSRLKWPGQDRRHTLDRRKIWRFHVPEHLSETCDLQALPLTDAHRAVLNEHTSG